MSSETVIDYIIRISGNSNKITRLVEYLTTVSDKDSLLCKVRSADLFYKAVPRFFASGVFSSIRNDYDIKPKITNHFLARLMFRVGFSEANHIFWMISSLTKHIRRRNKNYPRTAVANDFIHICYDGTTDSLISIRLPSTYRDLNGRRKRKGVV